jgi:hypothetical protein
MASVACYAGFNCCGVYCICHIKDVFYLLAMLCSGTREVMCGLVDVVITVNQLGITVCKHCTCKMPGQAHGFGRVSVEFMFKHSSKCLKHQHTCHMLMQGCAVGHRTTGHDDKLWLGDSGLLTEHSDCSALAWHGSDQNLLQ